jgi:hypothetical protein
MHNENAPGAAGTRAGSEFVGLGGTTSSTIAQALFGGKPTTFEGESKRYSSGREKLLVEAEGPDGSFVVTGQTAKALLALMEAGEAGRTSLEVTSWAFRFGAYVWTLRHQYKLVIETQREVHEGGWHARYVLASSVKALRVLEPEGGLS